MHLVIHVDASVVKPLELFAGSRSYVNATAVAVDTRSVTITDCGELRRAGTD